MADDAAAALAEAHPDRLRERLTLLGMSMMHGKDEAVITAWLHETTRLLEDLPEGLLFAAIDACVKEPGRVFCPTVGEIRAKLAEPLRDAELEAAHLREMANLIAEGVEIPDYEPPPPFVSSWSPQPQPEPWKPEPGEIEQILREEGLAGTVQGEVLGKMMAGGAAPPTRPKSRADYIAQGRTPPPLVPPIDQSIQV